MLESNFLLFFIENQIIVIFYLKKLKIFYAKNY